MRLFAYHRQQLTQLDLLEQPEAFAQAFLLLATEYQAAARQNADGAGS